MAVQLTREHMCTHFAIFVECIYVVWWTQKWRCEIDGAKLLTMKKKGIFL